MTGTYIDTSALAKYYVPETGSDDVDAWIRGTAAPTISSLTLVEMRCLLARRRRARSFGEAAETRAYACFLEDIDQRHLAVEPIADDDIRSASRLITRVGDQALRTLDAIHLTICTSRGIRQLATADSVMAAAADELGLDVTRFD